MPRISIYLSQETMAALKAYLEKHHPNKRATSLVVEQAIKEWLEKAFSLKAYLEGKEVTP